VRSRKNPAIIPEIRDGFATADPIMKARRIQDVIRASRGRIGRCVANADRLQALNRTLFEVLPAPLHRHVQAVRIEGSTLVLKSDSSAWQAKLRFQLPQIKRLLRQRLDLPIRRIETGVLPRREIRQPAPRQAQMSAGAGATLERAALAMDDVELRAALQRLARHGKR
jgi:hypothetical protein